MKMGGNPEEKVHRARMKTDFAGSRKARGGGAG